MPAAGENFYGFVGILNKVQMPFGYQIKIWKIWKIDVEFVARNLSQQFQAEIVARNFSQKLQPDIYVTRKSESLNIDY